MDRPWGWYADVEGQRLAGLAHGTVLEIGTAYGRSASYILDSPAARLVSVEIQPQDAFMNYVLANDYEDRVLCLWPDTEWAEPVDLLHIDGNHAYEAVRADYEKWSPLVTEGGWIAFHDSQWRDVGRFIREIAGDWRDPSVTQSLWTACRG